MDPRRRRIHRPARRHTGRRDPLRPRLQLRQPRPPHTSQRPYRRRHRRRHHRPDRLLASPAATVSIPTTTVSPNQRAPAAVDGACTTSGADHRHPCIRHRRPPDHWRQRRWHTTSTTHSAEPRLSRPPTHHIPARATSTYQLLRQRSSPPSPRVELQHHSLSTPSTAARPRPSTTAAGSSQKIRHYTDTTDNPTWVTEDATSHPLCRAIGSDLALTVDGDGSATLSLANNHGDVRHDRFAASHRCRNQY